MTPRDGAASLFRRLRGRAAPAASKDDAAEADHEGRVSDLREAARTAATSPDRAEEARMLYREAVAASRHDGSLVLEYARFLIARSHGPAAEELLAISLAVDGAQIDALELYLELVRELELPASRSTWALQRMSTDIAASPQEHRGALDYAIPHQLTEALDAIEAGTDPVNRAIVQINRAYIDKTFSEELLQEVAPALGENDRRRAHLTVALARGNRRLAKTLLEGVDPKAVPLNALRRAIRRARATGKQKQLLLYLEAYLRLRPEDAWAKQFQKEVQRNAVSNYQLGRTGFPFPKAKQSPVYEPRKDHVLYLLHTSLPHNSVGYATRTHGLLTELNRIGWDVDGVTRLGYPYDMPGKDDLPDVPLH